LARGLDLKSAKIERETWLQPPMSIYSHATSTILWGVQPLVQLAAAGIFWRRKLHKHYPVFFTFLLLQVGFFGITFLAQGNRIVYFWAFWLLQAVNAALGFKIIHEVFLDVFRPYHALQDLGTPVFTWAGAVLVLAAVVIAASNSSQGSMVGHAILNLQRSVRTVQFGLVLFLLIFARFLGISRKQLCFGISLGFGLFAGAELVLLAAFSGKLIGPNLLNVLNMFAYDISMLAWFVYACSSSVTREKIVNPLRTQRWETSMGELHPSPAGASSLIPMFEGMVQEAFSRSANTEAEGNLGQMSDAIKERLARSAKAGSKSDG
jgi:hypothetical protein